MPRSSARIFNSLTVSRELPATAVAHWRSFSPAGHMEVIPGHSLQFQPTSACVFSSAENLCLILHTHIAQHIAHKVDFVSTGSSPFPLGMASPQSQGSWLSLLLNCTSKQWMYRWGLFAIGMYQGHWKWLSTMGGHWLPGGKLNSSYEIFVSFASY